jgi:uroporphyrin-III C-methyltransferase
LMRAPSILPTINGDSAMPVSDPAPSAGAAVPSAGATASSAGAAAGGAATQALTALRGDYPVFAPGEVWLAGAGPGDPGLLTLDALAALLQADVVVHDALVDARVLALARTGAQLQFAGKRGGKPSIAQEDICLQLVDFARRGFRVLRLKGGDPFVFGRGGEEMLALAAAGVPFRVIPGVTAGLGGLASVGIPATMRGVNQAIILATGHDPDEDGDIDWSALARTHQPIVLYMGLRNLDKIAQALMRGGLPASTPAAVIASATLSDQRVLASRLDSIASEAHAANMAAPAMVVIGEIVRTRQQLVDASAHAAAGAPSSACEG